MSIAYLPSTAISSYIYMYSLAKNVDIDVYLHAWVSLGLHIQTPASANHYLILVVRVHTLEQLIR